SYFCHSSESRNPGPYFNLLVLKQKTLDPDFRQGDGSVDFSLLMGNWFLYYQPDRVFFPIELDIKVLPSIIFTYELGELVIGRAGESGQKAPLQHSAVEDVISSNCQGVKVEDFGARNVFHTNYYPLPARPIRVDVYPRNHEGSIRDVDRARSRRIRQDKLAGGHLVQF